MRSRLLFLALTCVLAASPTRALAQWDERGTPDPPPVLMNARMARDLATRAARPGTSSTPSPNDTVWVGYTGNPNNYWGIGKGPNRPGVNANGAWNWEIPVHGDSLQGWWPIRQLHTNTFGAVRTDVNRAWWAFELGNQANYVINQGDGRASGSHPGVNLRRTFGVTGVWHSDPGNTGAGAGLGVGWVPLGGSRSAWMWGVPILRTSNYDRLSGVMG